MIEKIKVAYIAGLFDGEGDVGTYKYTASKNGKRYLKLTARIHNTDKAVLDWVVTTLKVGRVFEDRKGIKKSGNPGRKQCYVYVTAHQKARIFLKIIYPYLHIKKDKTKESLHIDKVNGMRKREERGSYKTSRN